MIGLWISGCDAGAPIAEIDRRETEFIGNAFAAAAETPAPDGVLWHVGKNDRTLGQRRAFIEIAAREPLHDRIMLLHRHLLDVNQRDAGDDRRTVQRRMIFDGNILAARSEEHTSELQSLMRTSYAVFC